MDLGFEASPREAVSVSQKFHLLLPEGNIRWPNKGTWCETHCRSHSQTGKQWDQNSAECFWCVAIYVWSIWLAMKRKLQIICFWTALLLCCHNNQLHPQHIINILCYFAFPPQLCMWLHWAGVPLTFVDEGVASSSTPNGPIKWGFPRQILNNMVKDNIIMQCQSMCDIKHGSQCRGKKSEYNKIIGRIIPLR